MYCIIAGIGDGAIGTSTLGQSAVTDEKFDFSTFDFGNYSTSEVDTGFKWVDGKTVYKKTVNFGTLPNATTKSVAHSVTGLDWLLGLEGLAKSGSTYVPLNQAAASSSDIITCYATATNIIVITGSNRTSYSAYVTIWYTKT